MQQKSLLRFLIILFGAMAILSAVEQIVPAQNGYFYTDSLFSKIYFTDLKERDVLLEGPGIGRFYTLSPDESLIGFKYRETEGGTEAPALYHIQDGSIELLHQPVACAGQVSFSQDGKIAYTIGDLLIVENGNDIQRYDLGTYANLAPISPDGNYAVYNDIDDQLWLLNLENGEKKMFTEPGYGHVFPAWSADSKFISFSTLDGTMGIYDLASGETLDLGLAGALKWSMDSDEYAYLKATLNEDSSDIFTDVVVSTMESGKIEERITKDINEVSVFYLNDGTVMALNEKNRVEAVYTKSLKKVNPDVLEFQTDPVTFGTLAPSVDSYLDVPYVHQVYDTPGPRGYSSCAPTTAAMVLAYYGILPKWPFLSGFGNWSNYGAYVHEKYYYRENFFNLKYRDCNSTQSTCYDAYGGMGYMWTGGSPNSRMAGYYKMHGVYTNQTWSTKWSTVAAEIDKKQPFSICNYLSSSGHLIVAKGRTDNDQRTVIVNDPYGDRNQYSWPNYNGKTVKYDWPGYNHGHASLNYANSGYTSMPWCIATNYTRPTVMDSIVDDRDFDHGFYIKAQGNTVPMRYYRSKKSGYGGHHWWTYTETGQKDVCYVKWTPQVENGYYEIKAYIPANATASTAVYKIHHAAGISEVEIDQSAYSDTLVSLGKYIMVNDGENYVYLGDSSAVSGDILAFDAMVWQPADFDELHFTADYRNGYPNFDVKFWVDSPISEGEYTYTWDLGDGEIMQGDTITYAYSDTGNYKVSLTAEAGGVAVSIEKDNYISVSENTGSINLINPAMGAVVNTAAPLLTWSNGLMKSSVSSSSFGIYLALTPEFKDTLYCDTTKEMNYYQIDGKLPENKNIYWRITTPPGNIYPLASEMGAPSLSMLYSPIGVFSVNAKNSLPLDFDLISPLSGTIADTLRPSFSWETTTDKDPGDSLTYKLYLGTSSDSMNLVYSGKVTEYTSHIDLKENGNYHWYVEACDISGAAKRSTSNHTLGINTINEAPSAPVLIAPNYNSYQTTRYPYFEWTAAQDPDPGDQVRYKVFYWTASSTNPNIINTTETYHDSRRLSDLREYFWCVAAIDDHDLYTYSDSSVFYTNTKLDVVEIPDEFVLENNYPNPFNPITTINYGLPEAADVKLDIYDMNGRCVATLVNADQNAGMYSVRFDASGLASGIYLYRFEAGDFKESKKMLLMK
jgi:PKD repeat protein